MPLGKKLKELRQKAELSVRAAAKKIGKSAGYLSRIETRGEIPTPDLLIKIAEVYNTDVEELFKQAKEDYLEQVEKDIDDKLETALKLYRKESK